MSEHCNSEMPIECPFFEQCTLVQENREAMPSLIERTIANYCRDVEIHCARRRVYEALEPDAVPELMLPDQHHWAKQVIEEYDLPLGPAEEPLAQSSKCG